jgi:hypothetical protein
MAWWPQKGSTEWTRVEWPKPQTISKVRVYWFADFPGGGCKPPKSWRLLYRDGANWKPVVDPSGYSVKADQFVELTFAPTTTEAMQIEVQLQDGFSGGIHEWVVEPLQNTDG